MVAAGRNGPHREWFIRNRRIGSLGIHPRASGYAFCRKWGYLWLSKCPVIAPMMQPCIRAIIGHFESHKYPHSRQKAYLLARGCILNDLTCRFRINHSLWGPFLPAATMVNSLTTMVSYMIPHFVFELCSSLITFLIFVRWQRLIARNVRQLFSSNRGILHLNEASCIDELSRGSVLGYEILTNN